MKIKDMDRCIGCRKLRDGHWALLFSPPILKGKHRSGTWKFHLCPNCYEQVIDTCSKASVKI